MKKIILTSLLIASCYLLKAQNVGIGTTTPTSKLHVVSTGNNSIPFSVFRSTGLTPLFRVTQGGVGNGNASIHNAAGDTVIQLSTSGDSWLMGGELGIGTNVPTSRLHIISTGASTPLLVARSGGTPLFKIMEGGLGNGAFSIHNSNGDTSIQMNTSGNSWLLGGNVGIGTDVPSAKLHVAGSFKLENGTEANNRVMVSNSTGTATWKDPSAAGLVSGSGAAGRVAFWQSNDSIMSSTKFNWDNTNSFLGIGVGTPSEKLDIILGASESGGLRIGEASKKVAFLGDSTTSSDNGVLRLFDNTQTENVRLYSSGNSFLMGGNLGIGTTSPTNELTINSASPAIQLQNNNVSKGYLSVNIDDLLLATNPGNPGNINLRTSGTDRLTVSSTGLVGITNSLGIGTTAPTYPLTIKGTNPQIQLTGGTGVERGFFTIIGSDAVIGTNQGSTGNFVIRTGSSDRITVNSSNGVISTVANNSSGYAATIENQAYQGSGLLLSIKADNTYGASNNFIGFRHWNAGGSYYYTNGAIEGFTYNAWNTGSINSLCDVFDMIGIPSSAIGLVTAYQNAQIAAACMDDGVRYLSTGADYAEWLPREDPSKKILPATVVGVKNGKISYNTKDADQVMAISTRAVVVGNMPQEDKKGDYETVAFIGQVLVWVTGTVNAGDYIVASGKNNGSAIAIAPEKITVDNIKNVIGRSWETKKDVINLVNTVVGLKTTEYADILKVNVDKTKVLEEEVIKIKTELSGIKATYGKEIEEIKKAMSSKL